MPTTPHAAITSKVRGWPGVTVGETGRAGTQFNYGRIELGHLHGSSVAHLPLPRALRDQLVAKGQVSPHPVLPESGWVARTLEEPCDVDAVVALLRLNYERAANRKPARRGNGEAS